MTSTRPPTRKPASSKCAPHETIQLHPKHFSLRENNNNDVNLDDDMW